jgi:hypothetical protein
MSAFNSQASIPRFRDLMRYSEKFVTYPSLFLLGVLGVFLLMQNTSQAATPNDPILVEIYPCSLPTDEVNPSQFL